MSSFQQRVDGEESETSAPPSKYANSIVASAEAESRGASLEPKDDAGEETFTTVNGEGKGERKRSRDHEEDDAMANHKKAKTEHVDEARVSTWTAAVQRLVKGKAVLSREVSSYRNMPQR